MVPTDPPRLEDRNVRWCHCACREPRLSPVPCCSAWRSCSRGRTRWPEWKWQERLCERGDKHLWWLVLNKYLPYLCSDGYHFNEFKFSSSLWDFYPPPPHLSPEGKSTIPDVGKTPSALVPQSPSPRLNPSSAALCLCKASSPDNTMCCTAARLHSSCTLCSRCFPCLHLWTLYFVVSGVVIPSSKASPLSFQNICRKIIGRTSRQEGSSYMQPLPLARLIFTVIMLCISTRRLLAFIRKVWECISWVGNTNATNFFYGDPLVTSF